MNFAEGSNTSDPISRYGISTFLSQHKMPHEIKSAGIQSPRGLLCARLSYQFLSKSLPGLRGPTTAQKQDAEGLPKIAVPQRLAGQSWFGRYPPSTVVSLASKTPNSIGSKWPPKPDRAWRQVAGPKLTTSQLKCALVGATETIAEAHQKNRPYWRKPFPKALIQSHHPPVNILGGYKFPDAPDVKLREEKEPGFALTASSTRSDDNLDIPDCLKR